MMPTLSPDALSLAANILFATLVAATAYLLKRALDTLERVEMRQAVHDTEIALLKQEVSRLGHYVERRHAAPQEA